MKDPAFEELFQEPWRFEFPQAMRVLLRNSPVSETNSREDQKYDSRYEPVRIGVHQSLSFPASDIESLTPAASGERAKMLINFLGLTGPSGVMPLVYTQFLVDQKGKKSATAFLDIFNHRIAMLFYYAWEKYRLPLAPERTPEENLFFRMIFSLVGLGTEHLTRTEIAPDDFFVKYATILALQPRSANGLQTILRDCFNVPVDVEQFVGSWYPLGEDSVTRFGDDDSLANRLGYGVVVSEEYWSHEFMARVRIGPLSLSVYERFLPGGRDLARLGEICRFYSRDEIVFEVQLVLRKDQVPGSRLGFEPSDAPSVPRVEPNETGSRLGWTTWARSPSAASEFTSLREDAGDVIIRLPVAKSSGKSSS